MSLNRNLVYREQALNTNMVLSMVHVAITQKYSKILDWG